MRTAARPIALLALLPLLSCSYGNPNDPIAHWYGLTVSLSGMEAYAGRHLEVRTRLEDYDFDSGLVVIPAIASSAFDVVLGGSIRSRGVNRLEIWVDVNGNGRYDRPPVDHAWRRVITNVEGDEALAFVPDASYVDVDW